MKFIVKTNIFAKALKSIGRAVSSKNTIPALEGAHIEAVDTKLIFTGYNLELAIQTVVSGDDVTIKEDGVSVIPFYMLDAIVSKAPSDKIEVSTTEKTAKVTVKSGKSTHKILSLSAEEYPDIPKFDTMEEIVLDGEVLAETIQHTSYACATDTSKPVYTGSLFVIEPGVLTVVSCDGCRLAIKRAEIVNQEVNTSVVIPHKAEVEVMRLMTDEEVKILLGQKHVAFKSDNITIISRLIEGTFLDYKKTIPKADGIKTTVIVDKGTLYGAVDRLSLYCRDKVKSPIKMSVDNQIDLTVKSAFGDGKETLTPLEATIDGEPVVIGFNNQYLLDALKAFDEGRVKINFSGGLSPITITGAEDESTEMHLVVPMRLGSE